MYVFVILYVYMYIYTHNCLTPCIYNFLYQVLFPILTFNGIHWFILVHTFIITYLGLQMSLWIIVVNSSTHSAHFGLSQWQFTQFLFQFLLSLCLFVSICIYIYLSITVKLLSMSGGIRFLSQDTIFLPFTRMFVFIYLCFVAIRWLFDFL